MARHKTAAEFIREQAASSNGRVKQDGKASAKQSTPVKGAGELVTRKLSKAKARPVKCLVRGFIALGKLTLMAGKGGDGKSSTTLDLIACVSMGRAAFGLEYAPLPPSDALLISCEDDVEDTIVPRLE